MAEDTAQLQVNAIFADRHFERLTLGKLLNKGGAAGKIYEIVGQPAKVAKIFHERQKSNTNRLKLEAMVVNNPNIPSVRAGGVEYVQIAWPEAVLEDDEGYCVGYLMPFINTAEAVSLDHLMQGAVRAKLGLSDKYEYRVMAAYNVALMVASLHKYGHYIIDLKPANVSIYKKTMTVAMFDCDGFSIQGEQARFPAEFVSEEYIYPEGMAQSCEDMGEEQDKFALAVIIFKLLNNGIHPFSGVPRKNEGEMLTIQNRIEQYHYAYGLWPDTYQAPHPYSIHEYFDKKTLELFERAFVKGGIRPSAREWQEHLHYLMHNLKTCRKDTNHAYFTAKGCGLCVAEERFKETLLDVKKQRETPQMVRGMEISSLSVENLRRNKEEKKIEDIRMQHISYAVITVYMLFFTFLFKILSGIEETVREAGLGIQAILTTFVMLGINKALHKYRDRMPLFQNKALTQMLQVYALICMIIALVTIDHIPQGLLELSR